MARPYFQNAGFQRVLKHLTPLWTGILVVALAGFLYSNTLDYHFTNWDDGMIYGNRSIRNLSWEGIKKIFTFEKANAYQPVRMLSYAIDYRMWELNPKGYRITNILFYLLTCMMVFLTLRVLSSHLRGERLLVPIFA
jgi:hypothetical protein